MLCFLQHLFFVYLKCLTYTCLKQFKRRVSCSLPKLTFLRFQNQISRAISKIAQHLSSTIHIKLFFFPFSSSIIRDLNEQTFLIFLLEVIYIWNYIRNNQRGITQGGTFPVKQEEHRERAQHNKNN